MSSAAPSPSPAPAPRATANPQPPTLLSLPIDVIYLILRQVKDTRSLVALFATCKRMRQIGHTKHDAWTASRHHHKHLHASSLTELLISPSFELRVPTSAPPIDIRKHASPAALLALLCLSPAWFRVYARALLGLERGPPRLRAQFRRSVLQMVAALQCALGAFMVWRNYVEWRHATDQFSLTSIGANLVAGANIGIALNYAAYRSPVPAYCVSGLCLAFWSSINLLRSLNLNGLRFSAAMAALIGVLSLPWSAHERRRRSGVKESVVILLATVGVSFTVCLLGLPAITAGMWAMFGCAVGYLLVPPLPRPVPRVVTEVLKRL